jgi:hypothetical protein
MLTATTSYAQTPAADAPVALGLNKDLLVGRWSAGNEDITLTKSGASYISINNKTCPGTWTLSGKTLVIIPTKMMRKKGDPCSSDRAWQVTSVSTMNLELIDEAKNQLHLTRQK